MSYDLDNDFARGHGGSATGGRGGGQAGKGTPTSRIPAPPGTMVAPFDATAAWATILGKADAATAGGGDSLPGDLRGRFEGSLGADLGGVRVHTGAESAQAASAVSARAYTVGQNIHFGAAQYDPGSTAGQSLIAHEVAHTVQQGPASLAQCKLEVSATGDAAEVEADRAAEAMIAGQSAAVTPVSAPTVARLDDGSGTISDPAPPPQIPKWYQHQSTGQPSNGGEATIYFGTDDAYLTPSDQAALEEFKDRWGDLLQSGDYELDIVGFADERAGEEYNENLAALRAQGVFDDLSIRLPGGMPEGSYYRSEGEVPSSQHPDALAHNRRVEIRVKRRVRPEPFPLPNMDPPKTGGPSWVPPADWSTEWEVKIEGGANAGLLLGGDVASMMITNLKNGESERFIYTGAGIGASLIPIQASGSGGPYRFNTSAPVPIRVFKSPNNSHFNIGVNVDAGILAAFGLPNGLSGEVWVFTGPRAGGADVVYLNTSGPSTATPNAGVSGTMGPMW